MLSSLLPVFGWICIGIGSFFFLVGIIGVLRMPDIFTRIHAASVADTLGAPLMISGVILLFGATLLSLKLVLLILFLFITGPASVHALAKAALRKKK